MSDQAAQTANPTADQLGWDTPLTLNTKQRGELIQAELQKLLATQAFGSSAHAALCAAASDLSMYYHLIRDRTEEFEALITGTPARCEAAA